MARLPDPGGDDGTWGGILNDYLSQSLASDGKLKTDSVTAAQLAPGSVQGATIANSAITTAKLVDGAVTESKLDPAFITTLASPVTSVNTKTGVVVLDKTDIGLTNVDNTSDANKPISSATQTALDGKAVTVHAHTAANISDSTAVGRSVMTATDAAAGRTAIGAGTSSLVIGTTTGTAKEGDYQPTAANISDSTAIGRSLVTAADAAAARTAIGAGTGSVTSVNTKTGIVVLDKTDIGLTNIDNTSDANKPISSATQTALDGKAVTVHTHTAANISDSTAVGRSVMTATDAAAVRTAIGAGSKFSKTVTIIDPTASTIIAWQAICDCIVTKVSAYRVGGTSATINASKNSSSSFLSVNLSVSVIGSWMSGGAVQNATVSAGDSLEVVIDSIGGTPTQIAIQIDLETV